MEFDFSTLMGDFWKWVMVAFLGSVVWLYKSVTRHDRQIESISQDMKHRERLREEDRTGINDLKRDFQALRESSAETRESLKRIEGMLSRGDR